MTRKHATKCLSSRTLTCLFFFLYLLVGFGSTGFAEEQTLLQGKTVNINTGTFEQLMQVPLMTEQMAMDIIEYREETGDFQVLDELLQIDGFTPELLKRLKPFLLLEGLGGDDCTC